MSEPRPPKLGINAENLLLCPGCGGEYLHVDDVYVAGRPREDGPFVPVHVDASGRVNTSDPTIPGGTPGRRHTITLAADCELCGGHFAWQFQQHKGRTIVEVFRSDWKSL